MDYTEYYKARNLIEQIMEEDLLGPLEENEVITESPVNYYLLGKLYPRNIARIDEENEYVEAEESAFAEEELLALGNGQYPSAMGLTFAVSRDTRSFTIETQVAYYTADAEERTWKRSGIQNTEVFSVQDLAARKVVSVKIHDDLELMVHLHESTVLDSYKLTATLVNNNSAANYSYTTLSKSTFFQPRMHISNIQGGHFCELAASSRVTSDDEALNMELLYHSHRNYAVGHGCSARWDTDDNHRISSIDLEVIPEYEVLQMKPAIHGSPSILSMKHLCSTPYPVLRRELQVFVEEYRSWIQKQAAEIPGLEPHFQLAGHRNLDQCRMAADRLDRAILLLADETVFRAFALANETMLNQRKCSHPELSEDRIAWYPFQLAFLLQELESIVDPHCEERKLVDLLWFPTGGGKTEAYLGIAAFTLFYRRFRESRLGHKDQGVAVIMRYTLRLLSFQQFERASAMICSAELIRQKYGIEGRAFGIGLWAGKDLTPNSLKDAEDYLLRGRRTEVANPVQVKRCPWCGSRIEESEYQIDKRMKRMRILCPSAACSFHTGLPIHLIDEDIYANKPSFVIGTVDKFARIAFTEDAGQLLGIDLPAPPELIIQDELHLISGPLGTITGIYEAAISKLCERDGIKPKTIASTATIRNAENQILSLYGMSHAQFPPQGISIDDSYFAELSDRNEKGSRKYKGFLAPGSSRAATFVRIAGALLFASRYLAEAGFSDDVVDAFWTETGYFNTLRELGSALVRIVDNVQERYQYLKNNKFAERYPITGGKKRYTQIYEMTSRHSSTDLGAAIQEVLMKSYHRDQKITPLDFLIASNMISVGVDVPRLNNMLVVRQPLKTSEYIQATSRVGRNTPGLVMILYHPTLSRDRSHYETFVDYHATLYKQVEATSLTPFADRARDRALQALYIVLARYLIPELRPNNGAGHFHRNLAGLNEIREYIYQYVGLVDPQEQENVMSEIEQIEIEWEDRASHASQLLYYDFTYSDDSLYKEDYREGDRFRMMNSMRNVEPSIEVTVME